MIRKITLFAIHLACLVVLLGAETSDLPEPQSEMPAALESAAEDAYSLEAAAANGMEISDPSYVAEQPRVTATVHRGVLDEHDVILYYGHPHSRGMGILGEMAIEKVAAQLRRTAARYDALDNERGVIPGFHIVYATVYPEGEVGVIGAATLQRYIDYAEEHGMVVVLDHQLGRYDVVESVRAMLPLLHRPSVHFAIDPEWSTDRPNELIGSVTAAEINEVQQIMQDYLVEHKIEGRRMLLVHQFNWRMIENAEEVRADFERIDLIHNADGFGPPRDKHASWKYNARATNMPLKGFKLFYPKKWRDWGYDDPLMTPEEVFMLEPRPVVIQYQ